MSNYTCNYSKECNKYEPEDFLCSIFYRFCPTYQQLEKMDRTSQQNKPKSEVTGKLNDGSKRMNGYLRADETKVSSADNLEETLFVGSLMEFPCERFKECESYDFNKCNSQFRNNCERLELEF